MVPLKGILDSSRLVWRTLDCRVRPSCLLRPQSFSRARVSLRTALSSGDFSIDASALPGSTVSTRGGAECAYRGSVVMLCLATSPHLLLMMIVCRFYGDKTVETSIDATNGKATVFFVG